MVNKDGKSKTLSTEDMTTKAEICCCLNIIDSNCSFRAKYRKIFPDSAIANSYKRKSDKVKYMLQFGVAPFMRVVILNELKQLPFSFCFDETTTSQVKKQYDGYATYNSKHFGRIITVYLGTLFVGKCTVVDLLNHLNDMLDKIQLSFNCILSHGMDGPSVNLAFKSKLELDLEKHKKTLMDFGTCPLHFTSNAFREGLKTLTIELDIDLDQIVLDLFGFFKYSAKRIAEYFDVTEFTLIESRRMLKCISTRWISIQAVLIRVLEQFSNLKHYFLEVLPTQKVFNGKSGIGSRERYIRIKYALTNKKLPAIMASVIFIAKDFKNLTIPLQEKQPMITMLYSKMVTLVKNTLGKFIIEENFLPPSKSLKPIAKLKKLNLDNGDIQKIF